MKIFLRTTFGLGWLLVGFGAVREFLSCVARDVVGIHCDDFVRNRRRNISMRHDSQQGERIGFWFHLAFAGMYALAFAWHIKGAVEHARDMKQP